MNKQNFFADQSIDSNPANWSAKLMNSKLLFLFFLSLVFFKNTSWATVNPDNFVVENASRFIRASTVTSSPAAGAGSPTNTSTNAKVYGGIAGPACTGDTTCNNCTSTNTPCNANRISPNSYLKFRFQTDSTTAITATSSLFVIVNQKKIKPDGGHVSTSLAINTELFLEILWSDICSAINDGDVGCTLPTGGVESLQVGISTTDDSTLEEYTSVDLYIAGTTGTTNQYFTPCGNGTSIELNSGHCYMEVERGDEKIYIANQVLSEQFPKTPDGLEYYALRVFYGTLGVDPTSCNDSDFATAVTSQSPYKDLTFVHDGSYPLEDATITGLTNGERYYFRFANVDEAMNVFYFSADLGLPAPNTSFGFLNCEQHSVIPEEVVGLLDGKECFIATAAFGSSMAPQLDILRTFRDQILKKNSIGYWFVTKYYTYSPWWAQKIKKSKTAKALVRGLLSPMISMAQWIIVYGLKGFILLALLGFGVGVFAVKRIFYEQE